ncbi:hypothetical protein INT43_005154 [Umbelopsis isabellina]|uniref:Uncharacterized protein n=1 Tax=Mortierella isabellina TaxID=91625 RepID=A0A8H7PHK0_MORIS|nr:hypothetical protein INT43_005154 [Umbelopsis isabellina]
MLVTVICVAWLLRLSLGTPSARLDLSLRNTLYKAVIQMFLRIFHCPRLSANLNMSEKSNPPPNARYDPPPPPPYSEHMHTPAQGPYPVQSPGASHGPPSSQVPYPPQAPYPPQEPYTAPPTAPDSKSRSMPGDFSSYPQPPYPGEQPQRAGQYNYQQPNGFDRHSQGLGSSSGASSSRSGGILGGLLGGGRQQRDPLNPPPHCLSRPPRLYQQPPPFHRMQIPCNGRFLEDGFPAMYPGHAFDGHDVEPADWVRFIEDLAIICRLDRRDHIKANVIPMVSNVGLPLSILGTNAIKKKMKGGKDQQVGGLVDIWNGYYFNPRAINITLIRGITPLSGQQAPLEYDSDSSSSSCNSSDFEAPPGMSRRDAKRYRRDQKRAEKRDRRDQKRQQRDERRQQKRNKNSNDPYFLVIEYMPHSMAPPPPM